MGEIDKQRRSGDNILNIGIVCDELVSETSFQQEISLSKDISSEYYSTFEIRMMRCKMKNYKGLAEQYSSKKVTDDY